MKFLSRVVWSEGMHLGPLHFQTRSRSFEDTLRFLNSNLRQDPWGFLRVGFYLPGDLGDASFEVTIITEASA
jgi:predicted component of type VI protein secretion system